MPSLDDLENKTREYVMAMREAWYKFGVDNRDSQTVDDLAEEVEEAGLVRIRDLVLVVLQD